LYPRSPTCLCRCRTILRRYSRGSLWLEQGVNPVVSHFSPELQRAETSSPVLTRPSERPRMAVRHSCRSTRSAEGLNPKACPSQVNRCLRMFSTSRSSTRSQHPDHGTWSADVRSVARATLNFVVPFRTRPTESPTSTTIQIVNGADCIQVSCDATSTNSARLGPRSRPVECRLVPT
jgi:hypothetical protein